eukprot:m.10363 g.10363  ORF g.10363 m.10363 type:complete len:345 (+) comp4249_c0_seq1:169-1203(+)
MQQLQRAARAIKESDALVILSGAGMGVDAGLGTFRGRNAGAWEPMVAMRKRHEQLSDPDWLRLDPRFAWAFWRTRHLTYTQNTAPHEGYKILADIGSMKRYGVFSITSNIDGHWARTPGVSEDSILEVHGALTHWQPLSWQWGAGEEEIWQADSHVVQQMEMPEWVLQPGEIAEATLSKSGPWERVTVGDNGATMLDSKGKPVRIHSVRKMGTDVDLMRVTESSTLPLCPDGRPARPNVLMFGDSEWNSARTDAQSQNFRLWVEAIPSDTRVALVEVGAGKAVPTIRRQSEMLWGHFDNCSLIRINLDDFDFPHDLLHVDSCISVGGKGALDAIQELKQQMEAV